MFDVICAALEQGSVVCCVSGQEGDFTVPAVEVGNVVDTTGAGDNFVVGFISGILRNRSLRECAELGTQQAAKAITHTGGA